MLDELTSNLQVLNLLQTPIWIYDVHGACIRWANEAGVQFWEAEHLHDLLAKDFTHAESDVIYQKLRSHLERLKNGDRFSEVYLVDPDGIAKQAELFYSAYKLPDGSDALFIEASTAPSARQLAAYLSDTSSITALFDLNGDLLSGNPRFNQLFVVEGSNTCRLANFFSHEKSHQAAIQNASVLKSIEEEIELATNEGPKHYRSELRRSYSNNAESFFLLTLHDISSQKSQSKEMIDRLHTDSLTNLLNRHGFLERAQQALDENDRALLVFLDLNGFKMVNDTLGHAAGDFLLAKVAKRIASFKATGARIGRIGGDEFTILLTNYNNLASVRKKCDRLVGYLSEPYDYEDGSLRISASYGIAEYPVHAANLQEMLSRADFAMYRAKNDRRKAGYVFNNEMYHTARKRNEIQHEIDRAIGEEQLSMVYQPIIDLASGKVLKMEALVRWTHPRLGIISPGVFITLAEETGHIRSIGEWSIRSACIQAKQWFDKSNIEMKISVNVSAVQFMQQEVDKLILDALDQSNLLPRQLEVELTETALMTQIDVMRDVLNVFSSKGISIAIDDFGTGYSSLSYLHELPINCLKIDRSFISGLPSHKSKSIIRATKLLANSIGVDVIAEGIETLEQQKELLLLGCHIMQGYYYAEPMPAESVPAWLTGFNGKANDWR